VKPRPEPAQDAPVTPPASAQVRSARQRTLITLLALGVLAASAAGVGIWVIRTAVVGCDGAFNDRALREFGSPGECVGVTDGSLAFAPELAEATGKILAENRRVEESGLSSVSLAYFIPMTLGEGDTQDFGAVNDELRGAFLTQYNWNRETGTDNPAEPQVRLLLANPGSATA